MLRRLKTAAQQQSNKTIASEPVGGSRPGENSQSNEGLLCPECRVAFPSIVSLQDHYESAHSVPSSQNVGNAVIDDVNPQTNGSSRANDAIISNETFVCPRCYQEFPTTESLQSHFDLLHAQTPENKDDDIVIMRLELNNLRASLKEERRYSSEMKKEIQKVQNLLEERHSPSADKKPTGNTAEEESMYYLQQIQMLEAGKSLVATRMLELEKEVFELNQSNESLQREKNRLLEKSLGLSRDYAALQAKSDDETSQRIGLQEQLTKFAEHSRNLEIQLDERPSEDDVIVLRKELVHAQTLMDSMTLEKEGETAKLIAKCKQLEDARLSNEKIISDLLNQLDNSPKVEHVETIRASLDNEKAEMQQKFDQEVAKNFDLSTTLMRLEDKVKLLESEIREKQVEYADTQQQLDHETAKNLDLATNLVKLEEKMKSLENETREKQTEHAEMQQKLNQEAAKHHDLTTNLTKLEEKMKLLETEAHEKQTELNVLNDTLKSMKTELERSSHDAGDKQAELNAQITASAGKLSEQAMRIKILEETNENLKNALRAQEGEQSAAVSLVDFEAMRESLQSQHAEVTARWNEERGRLSSTITSLEKRNTHIENELKHDREEIGALRDECNLNQKKILVMQTQYRDTIDEKTQIAEKFQCEISRLHQELSESSNRLKEVSNASASEKELLLKKENALTRSNNDILELKDQLANTSAKLASANQRVDNLEHELLQERNEFQKLSAELIERSNELNGLQMETQVVRTSKDELAVALRVAETQVADLRAQLDKVDGILRNTREEMRAILEEKEEELDKLAISSSQAIEEAQLLAKGKAKELDSAKEEYQSLIDKLTTMEKKLADRDRSYEDVLATNIELKETIAKLECENLKELDKKNLELETAEQRLNNSLKDILNLNTAVEHLQGEIKSVSASLEEANSKLKSETESYMNRLNGLRQEFDEEKAKNQQLMEEDRAREEQLRSLTDSLGELRSQVVSQRELFDNEAAKCKVAEQSRRELEQQVAGLQEEKRMLLDQCLLNERDLEEKNDNCDELRRRLDDALAAMRELGREHQSFQVNLNRHFSRHWADDSVTHSCMSCNKTFSVTLRKHHCRQCGLIFCADCSSRTARIPSAPKPVRVCENCFAELNSR